MVERWKLRYQKYHQMTNFVCFTGDLKDKRNKVIPLEENPTTTTATLAQMNDETTFNWKQCWTCQHFPNLRTDTLRILMWDFQAFLAANFQVPIHYFFTLSVQNCTRLESDCSSGSSLTAAKTPQSCIKKELPVITKSLYLFLLYAGLHWLARAVNAVCPDQSSTTTQSWAGRLHCRLIVFNYNPPTCLAALYR